MLCQVRRKVSEDDQTKDQDGRRERTGACHGRERRQLVMEDLASVPWSRSLKALCVTNRPVRDLWAAPPARLAWPTVRPPHRARYGVEGMIVQSRLRRPETAGNLRAMLHRVARLQAAAAALALATAFAVRGAPARDELAGQLIQYRENALSVHLVKAPLAGVLEEIGRQTGADIRGELREQRQVNADFEASPLPEALHRLLGEQNFVLVYGTAGRLRAIKLLGGPQGAVHGSLDVVNANVIAGWAMDGKKPTSPVTVDIYDGDTLLASVPARDFRKDLLDRGRGDGNHGFRLATPASLKDGQPHTIHAKCGGVELLSSPKTLPAS